MHGRITNFFVNWKHTCSKNKKNTGPFSKNWTKFLLFSLKQAEHLLKENKTNFWIKYIKVHSYEERVIIYSNGKLTDSISRKKRGLLYFVYKGKTFLSACTAVQLRGYSTLFVNKFLLFCNWKCYAVLTASKITIFQQLPR